MLFHTSVAAISHCDSPSRYLNPSFSTSSALSQLQSTEQTAVLSYAGEENAFPCASHPHSCLKFSRNSKRRKTMVSLSQQRSGLQGLWALYPVFLLRRKHFSLVSQPPKQWLRYFSICWRSTEKAARLREGHLKSRNACYPCVSTLGLFSDPLQRLFSPLPLFHTQIPGAPAHTSEADGKHSLPSKQVQQ